MKVGNLRQLKYNIWMYFILYTAVIIMVLWVLQIIFLDSFYLHYRANQAQKSRNDIAQVGGLRQRRRDGHGRRAS